MEETVKESEVLVKISYCQKCNGMVRAAVQHLMDKNSKKEFMKDVMENDLAVKDISLIDYRKGQTWCDCKKDKPLKG